MIAELILWAYDNGYEVACGEFSRSDEQSFINSIGFAGRQRLAALVEPLFPVLAERILNNGRSGGIDNSLHRDRLAADLLLFRDGMYLTETADYEPMGQKWESMGGTWGGHFKDGNHFSLAYGGRK